MKIRVLTCLVMLALMSSARRDDWVLHSKPETIEATDNDPEARIIAVGSDVQLKRKGQGDFVPVIKSTLFRAGDTLLVGEASKATVYCRDKKICELQKGEYNKCCTDACTVSITIPSGASRRSPGRAPSPKRELPPDERRMIEEAERAIANLALSDTMNQFLLAHIYHSWNLTELNLVLDRLSAVAGEPHVQTEFGDLYLPMLRDIGDFSAGQGRPNSAENLYRQAVRLAVDSQNVLEAVDSFNALVRFYEKTGKVDKANNIRSSESFKQLRLQHQRETGRPNTQRQTSRPTVRPETNRPSTSVIKP